MDITSITPQVSGNMFQGVANVQTSTSKPSYHQTAASVAQSNASKNIADQQTVPKTADEARLEAVKKASEAIQPNYYVVSDSRFTIFKDVAGQYITRFTSLKDGKVSYYSENNLLDQDPGLLDTKA